MLSNIQCDDSTAVLLWPGTRPSPANVTTLLRVAKCTTAFLPPVILEPLIDHPPALEALSKLDIVAYSGGAVNPTRGEQLAKHIKEFYPILASTETAPIHSVSPGDSSRWNRLHLAFTSWCCHGPPKSRGLMQYFIPSRIFRRSIVLRISFLPSMIVMSGGFTVAGQTTG